MPGNYAAVPPVASANRRPFGNDITDGSGAPGASGGATAGGEGFISADSAPLKPLASVKLRQGTNEDASQLMPEIYRVASATRGPEFGAHVTAENAERSQRIVRATDNFSNANLLGRGAFGQVYKGRVLGCNMAIKRLQGSGWQGPNEYSMEVDVLSRMRHPHIVLLMGHCPDPNAMCILYDSVAGSVAAGPVNHVLRQPLAWYDRVRILSEVSGALLYLHQHSPPIAHRDLKPDNVLLDGNRMSKLGDVGLARLIAEDDYNVTARVQGTVGYIDPEEVATCEISVLSDVYAFGLIVLQLLMGEPQVKQVHRLLTDTAAKVDAEKRRAGRTGGVCSEPWSAAVDAVLARLDKSGGEWRADVARQLAVIGVCCADRARARRPDLQKEVQPVLMRLEEEVRREGEKCRADADNQLLCPISQKRMTDPVVAADGFTYERYMIEQWLERNNTSPITGQPFPHSTILLTKSSLLSLSKVSVAPFLDSAAASWKLLQSPESTRSLEWRRKATSQAVAHVAINRSSRQPLQIFAISSNDFRVGTSIELDGAPWRVQEFLHVKPGKGAAFVRTKLRNFITGNTVERTFRAGESVDEASVIKDVKQFTYLDGEDYVFMDMVTYEETRVTKAQLGDRVKFLKEGMECNVLTWNDKVIDLELPITLKVKVVQTDPGVKGDTAGGGGTKPATIETGATVSVPLFIEEGEMITVDTRTGSYMGRA
ncbi:unnamed protein product [Closterium sp. Yama58-4]|nr:unnamed protein product [Closterium sp. Yama58-4]